MHDHMRRDSLRPTLNRRAFLATMGGAAGSLVMGAPFPDLRAWADQPAGAAFKLSASEPSPKYGGTLRYGVLSAPAHFDVHQSVTVSNLAVQRPLCSAPSPAAGISSCVRRPWRTTTITSGMCPLSPAQVHSGTCRGSIKRSGL